MSNQSLNSSEAVSQASYEGQIQEFGWFIQAVNASFLSEHIVGKIDHHWVTYRDPDRDWYYKAYVCGLDEYTETIVPQITTDKYNCAILDNYTEWFKNESYDEAKDNDVLANRVANWKNGIHKVYSRDEHIRVFAWLLLKTERNNTIRIRVLNVIRNTFNLSESFSFDDFETDGMMFTITNYEKMEVRLNAISGIFGHFTRYGQHTRVLPNVQTITIPQKIHNHWLGDFTIVEVGPGVFDSLTNTEIVKLPYTLRRIDWSFWKCSKLKSIEIAFHYSYTNACFKSVDGVLLSEDGETLYAYPNAHGTVYAVPEGVTSIHKLAFKSCNQLETLILPSTLKHIGINAFYRCVSLKRIICEMGNQDFTFDGYIGQCGEVNPKWYFTNEIKISNSKNEN